MDAERAVTRRVHFYKMHGLGNDFIVIDARAEAVEISPDRIRELADRRRGVGFDQLLVIGPPIEPTVDASVQIHNADGSTAEQCGNGIRCIARLLAGAGPARLRIGTVAGVVEARVGDKGLVSINMGRPCLDPAAIPFTAERASTSYALDVAGIEHDVGVVSMGNPHVVLRVDDVETAPVAVIGPALESHPRFPRRTNVGFMQIVDRRHIRLRVHERGVGETLACGTGACAAVVWGRLLEQIDPQVEVSLPGGRLVISWNGDDQPVWMTGTATTVFEGTIAP